MIGMVLLRPGWERDYDGRPPVYPIGCSGVITHVERLPDGRYNIVLRGLERFRVVEEDHALAATAARLVESLRERAADRATTAARCTASAARSSRRCSRPRSSGAGDRRPRTGRRR